MLFYSTINPAEEHPLSPIAMQRATTATVLLQSAKHNNTKPEAAPKWPRRVKNFLHVVLLNLPQAIILSQRKPQVTDTMACSRKGREDRKPFWKEFNIGI